MQTLEEAKIKTQACQVNPVQKAVQVKWLWKEDLYHMLQSHLTNKTPKTQQIKKRKRYAS